MDALLKLSPAQSLLLRTAARRADGRLIPPDNLRGGARVKVLTVLLQRGWIEPGDRGHLLTDAGYAAIGQQRSAPPDDVQPVDTARDLQLLEGIMVRPDSSMHVQCGGSRQKILQRYCQGRVASSCSQQLIRMPY